MVIQRKGKVYTEIVPDVRQKTLQKIIRGKVNLESIIYSDGWRGYSGLVDLGYKKHFRVDHGRDEFANKNLILTALSASGAMQKPGWQNFVE